MSLSKLAVISGIFLWSMLNVSHASDQKGYIIILNKSSDVKKVSQELKRKHSITIGHSYHKVLNGFSFKGSSQAVAAISKRWDVQSIEEDKPVHAIKGPPPGKGGGGSNNPFFLLSFFETNKSEFASQLSAF